MTDTEATQKSPPSAPAKVKTIWARLESLISVFVLSLVIIGAWTTLASIHELLSPVKSAPPTSRSKSEMRPAQDVASMIGAGYWRVKDCQWALAMRVIPQSHVLESIEQRKTSTIQIQSETQDISNLTKAIKQFAPAQSLGGHRFLYEHKNNLGHFCLITQTSGQQETLEFALAAVPIQSSSEQWQVFEIVAPVRRKTLDRRFLLPVAEASLETCSRIDQNGAPTLQFLEVPEPLDVTLSQWIKAGWKLEQSIDLPFGHASYLCTRNDQLIMASILSIAAGSHELLLVQVPHQNSQEKNQ